MHNKRNLQLILFAAFCFTAFKANAQLFSDANAGFWAEIYVVDRSSCVHEGKTTSYMYYKCNYTVMNKSDRKMIINASASYDASLFDDNKNLSASSICDKNVSVFTTSEYQWANWAFDPGTYHFTTYFWSELDKKNEPISWFFRYEFPTPSSDFWDFTYQDGKITDSHLQLGGTTAESYVQQKNNAKPAIKPLTSSSGLQNQMNSLSGSINQNASDAKQNLNNATNATSNWAQNVAQSNAQIQPHHDICYADLYNTQSAISNSGCKKVMADIMNDPTTQAIMNGNANAVTQLNRNKSLNMLENIRAQCGAELPPSLMQSINQAINQLKSIH